MRYEITLYDKGFVDTHILTFPKMVGNVCDTNWMEFWVQPRQTPSEMETEHWLCNRPPHPTSVRELTKIIDQIK